MLRSGVGGPLAQYPPRTGQACGLIRACTDWRRRSLAQNPPRTWASTRAGTWADPWADPWASPRAGSRAGPHNAVCSIYIFLLSSLPASTPTRKTPVVLEVQLPFEFVKCVALIGRQCKFSRLLSADTPTVISVGIDPPIRASCFRSSSHYCLNLFVPSRHNCQVIDIDLEARPVATQLHVWLARRARLHVRRASPAASGSNASGWRCRSARTTALLQRIREASRSGLATC